MILKMVPKVQLKVLLPHLVRAKLGGSFDQAPFDGDDVDGDYYHDDGDGDDDGHDLGYKQILLCQT